jgi:oligopeptide transport system substrate-binding protein
VPRYYDDRAASCRPMRPAEIARSVYEIRIRPGIRYQPHPAFATDAAGQPVYGDLDARNCAASR